MFTILLRNTFGFGFLIAPGVIDMHEFKWALENYRNEIEEFVRIWEQKTC